MTLTVRLEDSLAAALENYAAARGVTKSLVVQESLAVYLMSATPGSAAPDAARASGDARVSANYRAFAEVGLIGGVALGPGADKSAVRVRVVERFAQRKARRGAV